MRDASTTSQFLHVVYAHDFQHTKNRPLRPIDPARGISPASLLPLLRVVYHGWEPAPSTYILFTRTSSPTTTSTYQHPKTRYCPSTPIYTTAPEPPAHAPYFITGQPCTTQQYIVHPSPPSIIHHHANTIHPRRTSLKVNTPSTNATQFKSSISRPVFPIQAINQLS